MFHIISYAIVWVKFTIGYFHVKMDYGKILSSSWVADKKLFNNIIIRVEIFVALLTNSVHLFYSI